MEWYNIVITIGMPVLVIAYIAWDLMSHKYTANNFGNPNMTADPKINDRIFQYFDQVAIIPEPPAEEQIKNFNETLEKYGSVL